MNYVKSCLIITMLLGVQIGYSQNYDVGDEISATDQNIVMPTCYAGNLYEVADDWKLADWNGATNGGDYNVIFIAMHASWDAVGYTWQKGPGATVYQGYADTAM